MRLPCISSSTFVASVMACLLAPRSAHAYLDAGTGSMLIQFAIAAVVGILFALKIFWRRIRMVFARLLSRKAKDGQPER